jgi:tetraacyldisaccharide 4'-kinase
MDEQAVRDLVSGKARGLGPAVLRPLLTAASWFYGGGVRGRNFAFDCGWKAIHAAPVPVVSVGNLTTGGTGKTPFTAWLADWFQSRGVPVALLSRGYRSLPGETNDEKLVLDRLCPGVPHLQGPDRAASAQRACREHGSRVLILDDGFQHRRLSRTLDIVLVDALNPWGYGRLLPRGLLREPMSSLRRADLIVITRADQCTAEQKQQIVARIKAYRPGKPCVEAAFRPVHFVNTVGEVQPLDALQGVRAVAFCGIANPDGFVKTLTDLRLDVVAQRRFPDHHHYTADDLASLQRLGTHHSAAAFVATQKDLVKIDAPDLDGRPVYALQIGTQILTGREQLEDALQRVLQLLEA